MSHDPIIPQQWSGESDPGERWTVTVEDDRMTEGKPLVVTLEVEEVITVPDASGGDNRDKRSYSLARLTPAVAREIADALSVYAFLADKANRSTSLAAVPDPPSETNERKQR